MTEAQKALSSITENDFETAMKSFQDTFDVDKKLFKSELAVNYAYCDSLFEAGVLTRLESEKIKNGLQTLSKRAEFDKDYFNGNNFNTISEFIEDRLVQLVGTLGRKISIGRSSKDLNLTVLRFWIRNKITKISEQIREVQLKFLTLAENNQDFVFIAKTNSRQNQPILFAQWCLAYFEMFSRDRERLDEVWRRTNILPLGAKVGNGSTFEIDREELARKLNFEGISVNNLDAVNDRDFVIELINSSILVISHFSQLSNDLLAYSQKPEQIIKLANENHEKSLFFIIENGIRLQGFQVTLNSVLLGSSTDIKKDFSKQNEIIFKTIEILSNSLKILEVVLSNLTFNDAGNFNDTDKIYTDESEIFEYLIHRGLSFEAAENTSKKLKNYLIKKTNRADILIDELKEISDLIEPNIFDVFDVKKVIRGKDQIGGTSPERISDALEEAAKRLRFEEK